MLFTPDDADAVLYGKCQALLNDPDLKHLNDIEIIKNGRSWMYNKIFIYLHYPYLGEDLKDSELVIIEETLAGNKDIRSEETAGGDLEENISLPCPNSHNNSSTYLCPVCGKVFKEKKKFKDHCGRNPSRESLECRVCHRSFCSLAKLKQHQKIHTESGNQYTCTLCFKNFKHRRNLSDHFKQHSKKSEFKCGKCFKTFFSAHNLKRHEGKIYCSP